MTMRACIGLLFALAATPVMASDLISPFAGSEALGEYRADFVKYHYLPSADAGVEPAAVEGSIVSRLFKKPAEKSNFEVFKSFERELKAAGFEMLTVADDKKRVELSVRGANDRSKNDMVHRRYVHQGKPTPGSHVALVATQAQEYIAARKTIDGSEVLIVAFTSRSGNYAIEEIVSAAMEEGTVVLSLEALRGQMESEGRVAIYGIFFDSASATLEPESAETLSTIVAYLKENPEQSFYVVGHTDDQGDYAANLALSKARAEATVEAILARLPGAGSRLQPEGVGPLAPVATNLGADGRKLNRRVELVSALD